MSYQPTTRLINVEEYHKMGEHGILTESDRVELIQGQIIHMSPIGSKHAACVDKILALLLTKVSSEQLILRIQSPISLDKLSEPEPDITILKPSPNFYAEKHPGPKDILLIIEVSDTSYAYDREIKHALYAFAGIPAYCIINIDKKEIEVFHQPAENLYKKLEIYLPGDQVEFKTINLSVSAIDILI